MNEHDTRTRNNNTSNLSSLHRDSNEEASKNVSPLPNITNNISYTIDTPTASIVTKKNENLQYIFRAHIPIEILWELLDVICVKNEKHYIIDFNAFRLLQYHNLFPAFANKILPAYKPSKQYYVTRTLTYNSFITIVRHICRTNQILFEAKFNYQHSLYNIDYYIIRGKNSPQVI